MLEIVLIGGLFYFCYGRKFVNREKQFFGKYVNREKLGQLGSCT